MPCFEEPFRAAFAGGRRRSTERSRRCEQAWRQPDADLRDDPRADARGAPGRAGTASSATRSTQRFVIDFAEYMQVCLSDYLMQCARIVKEETNRKKLTVFFYGYHYELSGVPLRGAGHAGTSACTRCCTARTWICCLADLLQRPAGRRRGLVHVAGRTRSSFMASCGSTRTTRAPTCPPADSGYGRTDTMAETLGVYRRNFGHQFERRCGTWWMDFGTRLDGRSHDLRQLRPRARPLAAEARPRARSARRWR